MKRNYSTIDEQYAPFSEINMIPFIDIALVLLIIFMVMTPFLVQSVLKVNLPKAATAVSSSEQVFEIQVEKDGGIIVRGHRVSRESLQSSLVAYLTSSGKNSVLIQADKDVPFQYVVYVMDTAKKSGAVKLGVAVKGTEIPQE
ncbi:MAG: hypothetical protein A2297_09115 [Elusimicrobia bacterium RIFOXYB2_FULL_48_7]|nr:MAG: hypothetical protein A2297_09115 [Elusimicrobia bacterium RIFOXYB2_FULL_48_7]